MFYTKILLKVDIYIFIGFITRLQYHTPGNIIVFNEFMFILQ